MTMPWLAVFLTGITVCSVAQEQQEISHHRSMATIIAEQAMDTTQMRNIHPLESRTNPSRDSSAPQIQQLLLARLETDEEEDRTLLDIFGEVAKDYFVTRIPPTDATCRWDWRSLRCEPWTECDVQWKWGDYHLGRSCRCRTEPFHGNSEDDILLNYSPAKRLASLLRQTSLLVRSQVAMASSKLLERPVRRLIRWQSQLCSPLWTLYSQVDGCLPAFQVPSRSIPERILCGPVDFVLCPEDEEQNSFPARPPLV